MQNCKDYVQIGGKIFIVIWHTFPVLLVIFSYIPVHREKLSWTNMHTKKEQTPKSTDTHTYIQINKHMDKYMYFEFNIMNYSTCSLRCFVNIIFSFFASCRSGIRPEPLETSDGPIVSNPDYR